MTDVGPLTFRQPGRKPGEHRTQARVIAADPVGRIGGDPRRPRTLPHNRSRLRDPGLQIARSIKRFAFPSSSSLAS